MSYRSTPHATTNFAHSDLLYNRIIRGQLPLLIKKNKSKRHKEAQENDAAGEETMTIYSIHGSNTLEYLFIYIASLSNSRTLISTRDKQEDQGREGTSPLVITHHLALSSMMGAAKRLHPMLITSEELCGFFLSHLPLHLGGVKISKTY